MQTSTSFRRDAQDLDDGSISLSEIISALSYALDLTEGAVHGHALRSCLLGMRIAAEAKLSAEQRGSLYFALLLKDIGCSSHAARAQEIADAGVWVPQSAFHDWRHIPGPNLAGVKTLWRNVISEMPTGRLARMVRVGWNEPGGTGEAIGARSDRGARIVRKLGMGDAAAEAVRSLEEHWDGDGYPDSLKGEQIPLLSRICAVAQHLDVFSIGRGVESAIAMLEERSGTWFDPELVRIAVTLDRSGKLWSHCRPSDPEQDTRQAVLDLDDGRRHRLESTRIEQICEAFADVVDAKSHFTFRHSMGVADAALGIATNMGLAADRVQLVRRAALLHDIGKLSVSNQILDKTSGLNPDEWNTVHRHPSMTRSVLERIGPFREMAVVAGEHHEKLDGSGYPHRLEARHLSLESRIIAVADVYGALSEDRPYRPGMMLDEIVAIMSKLAPQQLDPDCMDALVSVISSKRDMGHTVGPHLPGSPLVYAI
ncbi:MAG: HD domain-containing protein [Acidobacteriota bacterium]|nr:HD domain-containing protein [Acidobacteriota bacterium]